MNVDTLLEAAKYIELQEEKQRQERENHQPAEAIQLRPIPNHQNNVVSAQQPAQPVVKTRTELPLTVTVTTTTPPPPPPPPTARIINNSFDIINRLVIDESGEQKRKQPPLVFRSGTREVHNKLEKHRRAHLKECFDLLKKQLPRTQDERKSSNLNILHSALRYIQCLKRKERELEHEMEKLAREKITHQQRLAVLKKDVVSVCDGVDFSTLLPDVASPVSAVPSGARDFVENVAETKNGAENNVEQKFVKSPPVQQRSVVPTTQINGVKEGSQLQTTALSVLPMGYPMSQGLVLQKVALMPKGLTDLSPLVSNGPTVAHFITPQQLSGKVVPIVNAQYVVKPVVVVSTPSRPS